MSSLLRVFFRRALPEFSPAIVALLDHPVPLVRRRAGHALGNTRDPRIRQAAFARGLRDRSLSALSSSLEAGDAARVLALISLPEDQYGRHEIIYDLAEMFSKWPHPESAGPLLMVWNESPCSNCRGMAFTALRKLQLVPDWLIREAPFDCNEEVRAGVET